MGYAILRTQKLKTTHAIRRSLLHAFREQDTPNADANLAGENDHYGAKSSSEALQNLNARLPEKVRKNGVLAIEYLITASPESMHSKSKKEQNAYFDDAFEWLKKRHGDKNVIYSGIHRDEKTPHMYAYVVPLDPRGKLNCRHFLGGSKSLTDMQTEFADSVGKPHNLERGIKGSKAKHVQIKDYYDRVNAPIERIPEVKTEPVKLLPDRKKPSVLSGKEEKGRYESYLIEQKIAHELTERRQKEINDRNEMALELAVTNQQKAVELKALQKENAHLKQTNGYYRDRSELVDQMTQKDLSVLARRKEQKEAKVRLDREAAAKKATEKAQKRLLAKEVERRISTYPSLIKNSAGAVYNFAVRATEALKKVKDNWTKVDWRNVEKTTIITSYCEDGQSEKSIENAIMKHSPLRINPDDTGDVRGDIAHVAKLNEPSMEQSISDWHQKMKAKKAKAAVKAEVKGIEIE
jgi:hypothetical protein